MSRRECARYVPGHELRPTKHLAVACDELRRMAGGRGKTPASRASTGAAAPTWVATSRRTPANRPSSTRGSGAPLVQRRGRLANYYATRKGMTE